MQDRKCSHWRSLLDCGTIASARSGACVGSETHCLVSQIPYQCQKPSVSETHAILCDRDAFFFAWLSLHSRHYPVPVAHFCVFAPHFLQRRPSLSEWPFLVSKCPLLRQRWQTYREVRPTCGISAYLLVRVLSQRHSSSNQIRLSREIT